MSEQQNYLDSLEEIKAVDSEEIKAANMPIDIFVHEVKKTHMVAVEDFEALSKLGYPQTQLDKLQVLNGALSVAQLNWETQSTSKEVAQAKWKADAPAMHDLINELYDNMRFAYRNDERLISVLNEIRDGDSNADAVMDLGRLGTLGKDNPDPLIAIGFDITLCDTALSESERMGDLLAEVNGTMYVDDEKKVIRDKCYTLVKILLDEVRDYGKFAFRHDDDRAKLYASKYLRDQKAEYRRNQNTEEEQLEDVTE